MYDMFKKCGGKKEACARDKFVKKFATAVLIDGEPIVVADVENLFNASQVDYDYDNMSWDECVCSSATCLCWQGLTTKAPHAGL